MLIFNVLELACTISCRPAKLSTRLKIGGADSVGDDARCGAPPSRNVSPQFLSISHLGNKTPRQLTFVFVVSIDSPGRTFGLGFHCSAMGYGIHGLFFPFLMFFIVSAGCERLQNRSLPPGRQQRHAASQIQAMSGVQPSVREET